MKRNPNSYVQPFQRSSSFSPAARLAGTSMVPLPLHFGHGLQRHRSRRSGSIQRISIRLVPLQLRQGRSWCRFSVCHCVILSGLEKHHQESEEDDQPENASDELHEPAGGDGWVILNEIGEGILVQAAWIVRFGHRAPSLHAEIGCAPPSLGVHDRSVTFRAEGHSALGCW